ncbi:sigma factor [Streptomyces sp. NPDC002044]|uniref:sigma factor n=1 Tax=Streptomyces sp. NPDC002044 TaxID=3154662 RepID=UPI003318A94D
MNTGVAVSAADFQEHRPRVFAVAYRVLGSATAAEDMVQDAACAGPPPTARTPHTRGPGSPRPSPGRA